MEIRKQHIKIIIPCSLLLFVSGFSFLVLADENRHAVVDQAIGGMEQGRRISSQGSYHNKGPTSGNPSSPTIGNHGYIFTGSGLSNTPSATGTAQAEGGQANGNINTGTQAGQNGSEQTTGSVATGTQTGQTVAEQTSGSGNVNTGEEAHGNGGTTQESSGTSGNPIVGVEAGTNPVSETPNISVQVDTSGQLEGRQILDADVAGAGTGSSGTEVGSATDITGQELVHEADITTEPVAGTGSISPEQISTGSSTTTQEPAGTSGNPIVGVEAGINPESGTPHVGAAVDTTGELEDKQILQTDLAAEGIASSGQVGSASDITGSETVQSLDITTQPTESAIPIPSGLSAEVDTTGQTVGGTADIGEEASVSGIGESEDETCNPADGLTSTACGALKP